MTRVSSWSEPLPLECMYGVMPCSRLGKGFAGTPFRRVFPRVVPWTLRGVVSVAWLSAVAVFWATVTTHLYIKKGDINAAVRRASA